MVDQLECGKHGKIRATYVCKHILGTLKEKKPQGFHWMIDDEGEIQSFCDSCWNADDEEWEKISDEGPRLMCLNCLQDVAAINDKTMDLSDT